jgi:hypothetical protein
MSDINTCDCCGKPQPSIDLFWDTHWDEHTARQLKVIDAMNRNGFDAVCGYCFYELLKEKNTYALQSL